MVKLYILFNNANGVNEILAIDFKPNIRGKGINYETI